MRQDMKDMLQVADPANRRSYLKAWGQANMIELNSATLADFDGGYGYYPEMREGYVCDAPTVGGRRARCGKVATWTSHMAEHNWVCDAHYLAIVDGGAAPGMGMKTKEPDCWELADAIIPYTERVLLYGPPGTGKTYAGRRKGTTVEDSTSIYITEYTAVSEPRGNFFPVVDEAGNRIYRWFDGPALDRYRNGGRLVINEINKASDDCITFFLNLLDDRVNSEVTLPTGEKVRPHPNFTVVATMNGQPSELIEAMRDRFPVTIHIDKVNPEAVNSLSEDLREAARTTALAEPARRKSIRSWAAFDELRTKDGVTLEHALWACFGKQAPEMLATFKLAGTTAAVKVRADEAKVLAGA